MSASAPLLSMTGFGEGRGRDAAGEALVRIAAVNHKGAQVAVRGDLRDPVLEDELRTQVREAMQRGAITVHVLLAPARALGVDPQRLAAAWRELAAAADAAGAPVPAFADAVPLLAAAGGAGEDWSAAVRAACAAALAAAQAARTREGAALHAAMAAHAAALRALAGRMATAAAVRAGRYREALAGRLAEVLGGQAAVTPELLVRELALHAERIDITEEQVRLAAHLDALDALLAGGGAAGRRLDFLLQEIGREVNTTGAKANDAALQALVVDAKCLVDQLKEQAANLL